MVENGLSISRIGVCGILVPIFFGEKSVLSLNRSGDRNEGDRMSLRYFHQHRLDERPEFEA